MASGRSNCALRCWVDLCRGKAQLRKIADTASGEMSAKELDDASYARWARTTLWKQALSFRRTMAQKAPFHHAGVAQGPPAAVEAGAVLLSLHIVRSYPQRCPGRTWSQAIAVS